MHRSKKAGLNRLFYLTTRNMMKSFKLSPNQPTSLNNLIVSAKELGNDIKRNKLLSLEMLQSGKPPESHGCGPSFSKPLTIARANKWREVFDHNWPAAIARELFKPSTDAPSLLCSIKKNMFWFGRGVCLGEARKVGVFLFFWPIWRALDTNPIGQNFGSNFLWKLDDLPRR